MDMQTERILLVDDEMRIRSLLKLYLSKDHYVIDEAADGLEAIRKISENDYHLVLLDVMLPGLNGFEVCKAVREFKQTPIMMLTAYGDEFGKIKGFEAGADDYVTKPFSPREVVLRVKAMLNRTAWMDPDFSPPRLSNKVVLPYLTIEPGARRVLVKGTELRLTMKEFELLYFLARHPGKAYTREELLREVWRSETVRKGEDRTVDTHVKRIREKLNAAEPEAAKMIYTVWGLGYSLRPPMEDNSTVRLLST
ncbi:response regulator transcription factor [Paenibacillus aurantiacus]|uniref:Response regulator transcription factor n=1 Tax=Paenibacillus aurantiacus TaxID=1936118 RepID=A0ABV5KUR9_9BACL